jgi:exopolyphosphatase/guanosine-5'-triphosphate,3'-diphosphate pyrophosphatase
MLIASKEGNELVPLRTERRVTRLARGFQDSGVISPEAQDTNISALKEYASILKRSSVECIFSGTTGVLRRAANSGAVLDRIALETGIRPVVLSEETEAFLSAKGVLSVLPQSQADTLSFDIGGGSTEFLLLLSGSDFPAWSASVPIGASTITQSFLRADPPGPPAVEKAALAIRNEILSAKEQLYATLHPAGIIPFLRPVQVVGTAGTVTTLAAMYLGMDRYVPYKVNGLFLSEGWLSTIVDSLSGMSLHSRRSITGLEPGREDIILGGALIVREILNSFNRDGLLVTDAGLLEGLLLDLVEKQCEEYSSHTGLRTRLTWRLQKR